MQMRHRTVKVYWLGGMVAAVATELATETCCVTIFGRLFTTKSVQVSLLSSTICENLM